MGEFDPPPIFNPQPMFPPTPFVHPWDDQLAPMRHGGPSYPPLDSIDPHSYHSPAEYQDALAREHGRRASEAARHAAESGAQRATVRSYETDRAPTAPTLAPEEKAAQARQLVSDFIQTMHQNSVRPAGIYDLKFRQPFIGARGTVALRRRASGWNINGYQAVLTDGRLVAISGCVLNRYNHLTKRPTKIVQDEREFLIEAGDLREIPLGEAPDRWQFDSAVQHCVRADSGAWK